MANADTLKGAGINSTRRWGTARRTHSEEAQADKYCRSPNKVSSRVKDARSKERPLSSTSQPANIANGDFTPEETDARTVITSFDTLRWGWRTKVFYCSKDSFLGDTELTAGAANVLYSPISFNLSKSEINATPVEA